MTGFILLDVAIGVIFALLVFSLIASAIQEAIASALNWRGRLLRRGLYRLLEQQSVSAQLLRSTRIGRALRDTAVLTQKVLDHPLIQSLHGPKSLAGAMAETVARFDDHADEKRLPSSIPKAVFARALVDILQNDGEEVCKALHIAEDKIKAKLEELGQRADEVTARAALVVELLPMDRQLRKRLVEAIGLSTLGKDMIIARLGDVGQRFVTTTDEGIAAMNAAIAAFEKDAEARLAAVEAEIANWFDRSMDRVIGWYVRRAKVVLFVIGFAMALVTNFNVIGYASDLLKNDDLRNKITARAEMLADTGKLGERKVGEFGSAANTLWYSVDTDGDRKISQKELDDARNDAARGPLLRKDGGADLTPAQAQERYNAAWERLKVYDTDGKPGLSAAEADAAADASIAQLESEVVSSLATLNRELGEQGVPLGWQRRDDEGYLAALWRNVILELGLLSWLIVGFGCTLGGQFWFDLLKTFLKVRTAAAGLQTDIEKPSGGGSNSGGGGGPSPV